MLTAEQIESITHIRLPARYARRNAASGFQLSQRLRDDVEVAANVEHFRCRGPQFRRVKAETDDGITVVIEFTSQRDDYGDVIDELWRCSEAEIIDGLLVLKNPIDRRVTQLAASVENRDRVYQEWIEGISYQSEVRDANGDVQRSGLRRAQLGALHAIASHWTISNKPATVVMPTGTGKTEVMIASAIANQAERVLIIVPSDALRWQTLRKFGSYGVLRNIGIVSGATYPVCGILSSRPTDEHLNIVEQCNVVIATMSSISRADAILQGRLASQFSHIFFDEAHHKEASTWKRFYAKCTDSRLLLLTATPFRQDGRAIGGKYIYTFPLHEAQQDGYFKPIRFIEVFQPDETLSDQDIAAAAVQQLREDLDAGFDHLLMARSDTIEGARKLYETIYEPEYADLRPVVIHNQTPRRGEVLERILSKQHKIIVCVDMFGEGFDLPELKIAALHVPHKSLGVSLQFIGRFARGVEDNVGDATFVANLANDGVPESLDSLYQEDADWNEIVSDLSYDAINPHAQLSELVDNLNDVGAGDGNIEISTLTLRPKISAQVYRVDNFYPRRFTKAFTAKQTVVQPQVSDQDNMLILIVNQQENVEWTDSRDIALDTWDLYLAYYDPHAGLLYTHCSRKGTAGGKFAKAISENPTLIRDEQVFKAFSGLRRLVLHSVGLTGRSRNVRYQMFAGLDVRDAVNPLIQNDKQKSNITGVGYEDGKRTNVGCSRKGKIWSMQSGSVVQWKNWCDRIGAKLTLPGNEGQDFLRHTLIPQAIHTLPNLEALMADWPDHLFASFNFRFDLHTPNGNFDFDNCEIVLNHWNAGGNGFTFDIVADEESRATLRLELVGDNPDNSDFNIRIEDGLGVEVSTAAGREPIEQYFSDNPPLVRLEDGSQIAGNILLQHQEALADTYERNDLQTLDWGGTDLRTESIWHNGQQRQNSIQERFIQHLTQSTPATFIIDDDDNGESADIVAIEELDTTVTVNLWHCKYSTGNAPGNRASDLYEVCGQAQKSAKWTWDLNTLVKHLAKREQDHLRGRPTRFLRGNLQRLFSLRKAARLKYVKYRIGIVQPGLSKQNIPAEHLAILGATNAFVQCVTDNPLTVYSSV